MKRMVSLMLVLTMLCSMMPITVFASESEEVTQPIELTAATEEIEVPEETETTESTEATEATETIATTAATDATEETAAEETLEETEVSEEPVVLAESGSIETEENPWKGRSAVFVGDSITAGDSTGKYYRFLDQTLDFGSVTAMGVGGSCISAASDYGTGNQPLINRYQNIPSADLIVIFMGTNDYGHETPLGSVEDTRDGTFYGALNTIIPALVARHTSSKIVFVTPLHRYGFGTSKILGTKFTYDNIPNGVGAALGDYVDALKTVCANNGVSVIDLHTECTLDPSDADVRAKYMPDGIHPNAAGHEVVAGIMESHIRTFAPVESEPVVQNELIQGNKFASGNTQPCRASSRINYYLKAGTVITLKNPDVMQWACARTSNEYSSNNLGYFPEKQWTDIVTAEVAEAGWVGFTFKYRDETQSFDLTNPLSDYITIHTHAYEATVTAPTCTEQGYTTHTCECGESYVDDYVDATGHTYENGICTGCSAANPDASESMSLRYDDHYDITGKTVEIVDAGKPTSYQVGYGVATGTLDTAVVTVEDNFLVATGIGTAKVKIDDQLYHVTVERAKINLIVIMGQSNAGNHFENATSDVTCPIGTAYWWGNGKGTAATEPVPYTQPSMGFHTPLLAELYAQSVAVGDPVKNVLIWQEGITSKNGQSIVKWAASATNTSGTDATVTMIQNCRNYYEKQSDKYEIVNSGVYWLQGESDTAMDPALYTQLLMAIWERLENAGMEYLAFLRLRWGVNGNGLDHQDLHHSASLSAQIQMINENPNFYMATDLTENWVGTETATHTVDISKYITVMEAYGNNPTYTDVYGNHATYADGRLTTTMKGLYGSNNKCHYGKFGYGLIGADAAYNMYNALKTNDSAIVVTDTSGHANRKKLLTNGQQMTIDITNMSDDLSFRPACGSTAGTLEIVIRSGKDDITNHGGLLIADGLKYGSICVSELRNYNNASIEITYNTANGKKHTAVCNVITQLAGPKKDYIWNFNEDLYARDEEGNILNSFLIEPLAGSYTLENGYLTGNALMLQLEQLIELEADKNWCVEWKYGTFVNGSAGFLLCEEATNCIGNKAFYHTSTGKMMISDYADKKGYRNYTSSAVVIDEYDCLRITNRYDPTTGKSMLSLWKNGELVIENFQMKGSLNSDTDNLDMTGYPLEGNFAFGYLGHDKNSLWGMNCELDYLHISFGEEKEWCDNAFGPVITQQPVNGEAKLGERYMVEVKAEGEGLTYQWYIRNAGSKSFSKSSVKDNTYDDVMTTARAGREVYCVITDANGNSVITATAKLICLPSVELEIVTQPTNGEAVLGERYCVTVEARGESLKYQWYFRNKGATRWTKSSVTDNTYDDVMNNTRNGREVYCVITDLAGNKVTTDTVKLVRIPMKLEIVSQPADAIAAFGERFCATVAAKGEGLKYQWYYRNAKGLIWYKSGVRDNTYDDVMTKARNGREVYCIITDQWGNSVTTDTVKLIAVPTVELKVLGQTYESAAMGERYCVTVEAEGEGLTYQWYFRNAGATRWSKSGVRDNTYDDVMNKTRANREVYCVITDAFGNQVTTEVVTLELGK